MTARAVAAVIASVAVPAGGTAIAMGGRGAFVEGDGTQMRVVAGVLRNYGGGWQVLDNETHRPIGISVRGVEAGAIVIDYPESCTIGALTVTPDEHFAAAGMFAGASVSVRSSSIWLAQVDPSRPSGVRRLDPSKVVSSIGNLWVIGVFEATPGCAAKLRARASFAKGEGD